MIEIRTSPIHGKGVFATRDIRENEKICDYIGVEMKWTTFTEKYGKYKYNSLNTYPMRRIWRIIVAKEEPYKSQNMVNFINEANDINDVNCVLKCRALYASTEIKEGQELLLQYPRGYKREWKMIF